MLYFNNEVEGVCVTLGLGRITVPQCVVPAAAGGVIKFNAL